MPAHPLPLRAAFALLSLGACTPHIEDNTLEPNELSGIEDGVALEGSLSVTAVDQEGDWSLALGEATLSYHSPSHADLSLLQGRTVRAEAMELWGGEMELNLWEGETLVFAASTFGDGSQLFGDLRWEYGEQIGKGEVFDPDDVDGPTETAVLFYEVVVHGDDGDQIALPGEPVSVAINGVQYRLTVIASYQIDRGLELFGGSKCGPSDMLSVELIQSEEEPGESLVRPSNARAAQAGCG